jgi:hypothetical protein
MAGGFLPLGIRIVGAAGFTSEKSKKKKAAMRESAV